MAVWTYEDPTKTVNTFVVNELGERVYIPDVASGKFYGMTETTLIEEMRARGWTASFGCNASMYPYRPPAGWMCDASVPEVNGPMGSHGGCSNCVMYHLGVKVLPKYEDVVQQILHPKGNGNIIMLGVGILALGTLLFSE